MAANTCTLKALEVGMSDLIYIMSTLALGSLVVTAAAHQTHHIATATFASCAFISFVTSAISAAMYKMFIIVTPRYYSPSAQVITFGSAMISAFIGIVLLFFALSVPLGAGTPPLVFYGVSVAAVGGVLTHGVYHYVEGHRSKRA